jgi:hypothetical protein
VPASSVRNIRDNFIVAIAALPGSCAISVESLQYHCNINGNTMSGFTLADISTNSVANTSIANNRCGSITALHSIVSTAARGPLSLDANYCASAILLNATGDGGTVTVATSA